MKAGVVALKRYRRRAREKDIEKTTASSRSLCISIEVSLGPAI